MQAKQVRRDQALLLALKFIRMLAYGQTTMVLVPFFLALGVSDERVGVFMTLTLIGDVGLSTLVTLFADKWGRRETLIVSSVLMAISGCVFAMSNNYWMLLGAAVVGVISPSGDEVGPFRAIEESALAHLTAFDGRAIVYALQGLLGTLGLSAGALSGGVLADRFKARTGNDIAAYRIIFGLYAGWAVVLLALSAGLSTTSVDAWGNQDENGETEPLLPAQPEEPVGSEGEPTTAVVETVADAMNNTTTNDATTVTKSVRKLSFSLCLLFGIDSLAYGFMSNSWIVEYMLRTFGSSATQVSSYFSAAALISALTSLPSALLTQKIGSVLAIGLTKIGAGTFGAVVPLAQTLPMAMAAICFRSLFDTMDVVPRQVFLSSVVPLEELTRVLGIVNVVKTFARAIGPVFTGMLSAHGHLAWSFVIMGGLEGVFAIAVMAVFL